MTFPSEKPLKRCNFCGKEVRNLANHIATMHPKIMEQLDEGGEIAPSSPPATPHSYPQYGLTQPIKGTINDMIRDKLDTMLNIKIIEMLSSNPNVSLKEIAESINPQKSSLQELKEFHDIVYKEEMVDKLADIDTGNSWANVALQALPIVKEMLPKKINEVNQNVGERKADNTGLLKPLSGETPRDTGKSENTLQKPRDISNSEQQDNSRN